MVRGGSAGRWALDAASSIFSLVTKVRAASAMRLLHLDAPGRLILTDFRGKPIPPYAILSHRWGDSEILIEDIFNGNYKKKEEGYQKLRFCAEQAAQDGLQYFWIDTCCIDRWNNSERSKAINSMFQWYKNAVRCYVFLSDVSASTSTSIGSVLCRDWNVSLRRSKWFTRGWTLQELIAPASVEFFSCEGQRIGDKTSLDQLLHSITGIPLAALRNYPLNQFSISERMRWVSGRETTETEDMVYCLLGLLGVSMPATYGEGRENALERLQAEVEGAGRAPSIIPFARNKSFMGRELQLAKLEAKLFSNTQTTLTLAIVGPSGTGKSQLALEVAHRTLEKHKHCSSYTSVAQKLGVPSCDSDQADIEQICLLIFNNVEGTTIQHSGSPTAEATDLADFLPHSKLDTAKTLAPQDVVALRELTSDTALRMLQSRLTTPLSNAEQPAAIRLLRELSHLPLAVSQAAACINASNITHNQAALKHSNDLREGEQGESSLRKAVAATLSLSLEQLYFSACVDRKDIPLDLLKAASPQARVDAIMILNRYTLVTRRPAESAFDVHRLMQGRLHECIQRTVTQLLQRRLLPHAQYILSHSEKNDNEERTNLAEDYARALQSDGQYKRAEELYMQVIESRRRVLGSEHPDTLTSVSHLGSVLSRQGKYEEAEAMHRRALEGYEKVLGREHPNTLTSVSHLGSVLSRQGKYEEAEAMHRRALEGYEKVLGREHPNTLTSVDNLGSVLSRQGKYEEAEAMHQQALEGYEKVLGREHPNTLTSVSNLGFVLSRQGKYKEAEAMDRRALEAREKVLGREHPDTLGSVYCLAHLLATLYDYRESLDLYSRACDGYLATFPNFASTYRLSEYKLNVC
ncbi:kinesin light chain [Bipolaris maydis]|nr:kinesin light chain [Bipolaris maydis]KAJ5051415.1 kinesin light chain [Bipolaris maydis]